MYSLRTSLIVAMLATVFLPCRNACSVEPVSPTSGTTKKLDPNLASEELSSESDSTQAAQQADTDVLIEICDWQGGTAGAASISIDDSYTSCRDILNKYGFKGTYYLCHTDKMSQEQWDTWRAIYEEGHEIGGHTTHHIQYVNDEATLRQELESNITHIITNLNIPREKLCSFAWPCGETNPKNEAIAAEYYVSARGYHINELEDKNPENFMLLKCLNTPYYHVPEYDPPNYFQKADEAEALGKWVHYVFHNHCKDDGAIGYLATKDLWVAPVGTIVKYIKERQNSRITNVAQTDLEISFGLTCSLDPALFNEDLTIEAAVNPYDVQSVLVNGEPVEIKDRNHSILFNVRPSGNDNIKIIKGDRQKLANGILETTEGFKKLRRKPLLVNANGVVTNIWISGQKELDNLREHEIKYLLVDIGDSNKNGEIKTPEESITDFVDLVKSYETKSNYDFVILPYSEINTYHFDITDSSFRENFIGCYTHLISLGFDGIYIDIEPVRAGLERVYLDLLKDVSNTLPESAIVGAYSGYVSEVSDSDVNRRSDWEWSLDLVSEAADYVDFICVPAYDLNRKNELEYRSFVESQIGLLCSKKLNSALIFVVPTHERKPETIENALRSYSQGTQKCPYNQFIGVCIFAEWTTDKHEWSVFESYMK